MDNGPNAKQRQAALDREKRAMAKKNRERLEKEAKTPIVRRPQPNKKRKKSVVKARRPAVPSPFDYPAYRQGMKNEFYQTREWRSVRYDVIRSSNGKCVLCGRSPALHGIVLHVDHIKPRSKFPALELDRKNMQVLCEDCNIGKGAKT